MIERPGSKERAGSANLRHRPGYPADDRPAELAVLGRPFEADPPAPCLTLCRAEQHRSSEVGERVGNSCGGATELVLPKTESQRAMPPSRRLRASPGTLEKSRGGADPSLSEPARRWRTARRYGAAGVGAALSALAEDLAPAGSGFFAFVSVFSMADREFAVRPRRYSNARIDGATVRFAIAEPAPELGADFVTPRPH